MNTKSEAVRIELEVAKNGVIATIGNDRNHNATVCDVYVFNDLIELQDFIGDHFYCKRGLR